MASTKEEQHQAPVKHAPRKLDPAVSPPRPPRLRTADQLRHPVERRTPTMPAPPSAPVHDSLPVSGPLRLLLLIIGTAAVGAVCTAYYRAANQVVDDGHLELQGNIDVRQVNLAFNKVDGRIATLEVDEGDAVKAGQIVATLDSRYFEDDLRAAKARRDSGVAALEKLEHGSRPQEIAGAKARVAEYLATMKRAEQDLTRYKSLTPGAIRAIDLDAADGALREAEARLKGAEESLSMAEVGPRQEDIAVARSQLDAEEANVVQSERRMADSILYAPSDGVVLTRARERGAIVSPGETIFSITLNSPVWVRTYVNERDLGRIEPGMTAEVRTDSAPDKVYAAKIGFISPTAEFTPKTVETRELRTDLVYRLRVLVDNPDGGLRQGMPVTVTLDVGKKD